MAHRKVQNFACRGEKTRLLANEPKIVFPSSFSITSPPPYRASSSFQDASNLQYGFCGGSASTSTKLELALISGPSGIICASRQLCVSDFADWITSRDNISLLLKTLSFLIFHKNQRIHGKHARLSHVPFRLCTRLRR